MARVTVEDCLEHVENRFKLVLLASKRARQLALGTEPLLEWENDKPTVVALREIAENLVNEEMMQASLAAPQIEEESEFAEDDLAAALHAEISRELSQTTSGTPAAEPPVMEPIKTPEQQSSPLSSNTLFGGEISSDDAPPTPGIGFSPDSPTTSPTTVPPSEAPSVEESNPPPSTDSSDEGDQGF